MKKRHNYGAVEEGLKQKRVYLIVYAMPLVTSSFSSLDISLMKYSTHACQLGTVLLQQIRKM